MDLNSARMLNTTSWRWSKLAAFLCFALAGAILIFSLASVNGVKAEAKGVLEPALQNSPALSSKT